MLCCFFNARLNRKLWLEAVLGFLMPGVLNDTVFVVMLFSKGSALFITGMTTETAAVTTTTQTTKHSAFEEVLRGWTVRKEEDQTNLPLVVGEWTVLESFPSHGFFDSPKQLEDEATKVANDYEITKRLGWYAKVIDVEFDAVAVIFTTSLFTRQNTVIRNVNKKQVFKLKLNYLVPQVLSTRQETLQVIQKELDSNVIKELLFWINADADKLFLRYTINDSHHVDHLVVEVGNVVESKTESVGECFEARKTCVSSTYSLSRNEELLCEYLINFQAAATGSFKKPFQSNFVETLQSVINNDHCALKKPYTFIRLQLISMIEIKPKSGGYNIRLSISGTDTKSEFFCTLKMKKKKKYKELRNLRDKFHFLWFPMQEPVLQLTYERRLRWKKVLIARIVLSQAQRARLGLRAFEQTWLYKKSPVIMTMWSMSEALQAMLYEMANTSPTEMSANEQPGKVGQRTWNGKPASSSRVVVPILEIHSRNGRLEFKTQLFETLPSTLRSTAINQGAAYQFFLDIVKIRGKATVVGVLNELFQIAKLIECTLRQRNDFQWNFWVSKSKNKLYLRYPDPSSPTRKSKDHVVLDMLTAIQRWHDRVPKNALLKNGKQDWRLQQLQAPCSKCSTNERAYFEHLYSVYIMHLGSSSGFSVLNVKDIQWKTEQVSQFTELFTKWNCIASASALWVLTQWDASTEIVTYIQTIKHSIISYPKYRISFCKLRNNPHYCSWCDWSPREKLKWDFFRQGIRRIRLIGYEVNSDKCRKRKACGCEKKKTCSEEEATCLFLRKKRTNIELPQNPQSL